MGEAGRDLQDANAARAALLQLLADLIEREYRLEADGLSDQAD